MILIRELTVTSASEKRLLSSLDLNINKGQTLGIYGPNGSGKTTLLRAIAGISKNRILTGHIQVNGLAINTLSSLERARRVIYLGSDFAAPFDLQVRELFDLAAEVANRTQGAVSEVVEQLQIQAFLNRDFNTLSDGEKQFMMFARALVQKPEVLIFDESFSKLDLDKLILVAKIIRTFSADGLTIIVASHDLNFLTESADDFLFLKAGEKVMSGHVSMVLNGATLETLYPELPLHVVVSPETGRFKVLY